jgi:hypothetical protein
MRVDNQQSLEEQILRDIAMKRPIWTSIPEAEIRNALDEALIWSVMVS